MSEKRTEETGRLRHREREECWVKEEEIKVKSPEDGKLGGLQSGEGEGEGL